MLSCKRFYQKIGTNLEGGGQLKSSQKIGLKSKRNLSRFHVFFLMKITECYDLMRLNKDHLKSQYLHYEKTAEFPNFCLRKSVQILSKIFNSNGIIFCQLEIQ